MDNKNFKYIYGPVYSWRLGTSLGIDLIAAKEKACSFNCVYCQLGKTKIFTNKRRIFVPVEKIMQEFRSLPFLKIDYITFSGMGEPALAKNLGQAIKKIKKIRKEKIAVLTNSSLMHRKDVQDELLWADFVIIKLDACSRSLFTKVNRPMKTIKFDIMLKAIKKFRDRFKNELALQIMFVKENKKFALELAGLSREIQPDEIQINTPLRPCKLKPLSAKELKKIKECFIQECGHDIKIVSAYERKKKTIRPMSINEVLRRRGEV